MNAIAHTGKALQQQGKLEQVTDVVENRLGVGKKVSECTKHQVQVMAVILDDLKDLLSETE